MSKRVIVGIDPKPAMGQAQARAHPHTVRIVPVDAVGISAADSVCAACTAVHTCFAPPVICINAPGTVA